MSKLGKRLIEAAGEALAIARGDVDASTYGVHIPAAIDTRAIRKTLKLTQQQFATRYQIPVATLRDWEQGRCEPDQPARAYLTVIARDPAGPSTGSIRK